MCSSHSFGIPWNIAAIPVKSRKRSNISNDSNSKKNLFRFQEIDSINVLVFFSKKKEEGIENINSIYLFLPWLTYFIWYFFVVVFFLKCLSASETGYLPIRLKSEICWRTNTFQWIYSLIIFIGEEYDTIFIFWCNKKIKLLITLKFLILNFTKTITASVWNDLLEFLGVAI